MASVSSLDQDLKNLRLKKYTPQASEMVRSWISNTLGESLPEKDLMDLLKDGTILCRLANLLSDRPLKFKASSMPFVQMENISHFLSFISSPPVSLPPHDRFLTVDLFDRKDPAQVVQCLSAFSRAAHALNPQKFPETIGGLKGGVLSPAALSPQPSGAKSPVSPGRGEPKKKEVVTAWTKKDQEFTTTPAWNIMQYGYMGGASQNQGISFGARRQITQTPVISDFDKRRATEREEREKLRKQQEAEAAKLREKQDALKTREEELRRVREEERKREQLEREEKLREEEEERLRRLRHAEVATKAHEEREKELQAHRREKELRDAREEQERREKRAREVQAHRQRQREESLRESELREVQEEADRRKFYSEQITAQREADRRALEELEAMEARDSDLGDSIRIGVHRQQKEQQLDPLTRERERVKQLERELAEAKRREQMYLAARAELVWDPTGRVTLQQVGVKDSPEEEKEHFNLLDIPNRKLPTPPLRTSPIPALSPSGTKRGFLGVKEEVVERKKSWEEGDDRKPLDSPTKLDRPQMKWQRPASRGVVEEGRREVTMEYGRSSAPPIGTTIAQRPVLANQ